MPQFSYTARRMDGTMTNGSIDAVSLQAARASLQQMDLEVEELSEFVAKTVEQATVSVGVNPPPLSAVNPVLTGTLSPQWKTIAPSPTVLPLKGNLPPVFQPFPKPTVVLPPLPVGKLYFPLGDTFRLYAGWLLAWYFLIFSIGSYQFLKRSPYHIPYMDELFLSPVLLTFAFGAFLFLLLSTLHRLLGRGVLTAVLLTTVWTVGVYLFQVNT